MEATSSEIYPHARGFRNSSVEIAELRCEYEASYMGSYPKHREYKRKLQQNNLDDK